VFEVRILRKNANVIYGLAAVVVSYFDPGQYGQFSDSKLLQCLNAADIHKMMIRNSNGTHSLSNKTINNLLIGYTFVVVVKRTRGVKV
jgi:hypothetical protein